MTINKFGTLLVSCTLLLAYGSVVQAESPKPQQVKKPEATHPLRAKPVEKPQATSDRDRVSVSGYGSDPGEETQERPRPLDKKSASSLDPVRDPVRGPQQAAPGR